MTDQLKIEYHEEVNQKRLLRYHFECLVDSKVFWIWLFTTCFIYIILLIELCDFVSHRAITLYFVGLWSFFVARFSLSVIRSLRENRVDEFCDKQVIDEDGFKVQLKYSYSQFGWESFGFACEDEKAFKLVQSFIGQNFVILKKYLSESETTSLRKILSKAPIREKKLFST